MVVFTQYIDELYILLPRFGKKQTQSNETGKSGKFTKFYLFRLFPVVCTILTVWLIAAICTFYNLIPADNPARVDGEKLSLMKDSPYFYV